MHTTLGAFAIVYTLLIFLPLRYQHSWGQLNTSASILYQPTPFFLQQEHFARLARLARFDTRARRIRSHQHSARQARRALTTSNFFFSDTEPLCHIVTSPLATCVTPSTSNCHLVAPPGSTRIFAIAREIRSTLFSDMQMKFHELEFSKQTEGTAAVQDSGSQQERGRKVQFTELAGTDYRLQQR